MRSANIEHRQSSCLVLTVTLPAGSMISFSLRIDSEARVDRLAFFTTNRFFIQSFSAQTLFTTFRDWEPFTVLLPVSVSNLSWCYIKNPAAIGGVDSGWLDNLSFVLPPTKAQVCTALDMSTEECARITGVSTTLPAGVTLPQAGCCPSVATAVPWYISPVRTAGTNSLRSGAIDHSEVSCLVLGVTALPINTLIRFSLRTRSQGLHDRLTFFAGNQTVIENFSAAEGSDTKDWEQQEHTLSSNVSNLSWCYLKNASTSAADDSGWLDDLSFAVPLTKAEVCAALDLAPNDCNMISSVSTTPPAGVTLPQAGCCPSVATAVPWYISSVRTAGTNSLRSGAIDHSEVSCLVLGVTALPINTLIRFSLRTRSQGLHDRLAFFAGNQTVIENFSAAEGSDTKDWEQQEHTLSSNVSNLSWCYLKNASTSAADDSGWVDDLSFAVPLTEAEVCAALDLAPNDCNMISSVSTLPAGVTLPQEGAFATVATNVPWLVSTVKTEGASSLRSGEVSDTQGSCLVLEILPGTRQIRFSLRTSSQGRYDRLAFFAGNQTVIENFSAAEGSTTREWEQRAFVVTNDVSHLSWCYLKNGGTNMQGDDSGWLDNLLFIPRSPICVQLDLSDEECARINSTTFEPPESPWLSNTSDPIPIEGTSAQLTPAIGDGQQTCLILNVLLPDRALVQFFRRVDSQPPDELYFSVDGVRQEYSLRSTATTVLRDWSREVHILFESGGGGGVTKTCAGVMSKMPAVPREKTVPGSMICLSLHRQLPH